MTRKLSNPSTAAVKLPNQPNQSPKGCHDQQLLLRAVATLEAILEDGLTFTTEQEADAVIAEIKTVIT